MKVALRVGGRPYLPIFLRANSESNTVAHLRQVLPQFSKIRVSTAFLTLLSFVEKMYTGLANHDINSS